MASYPVNAMSYFARVWLLALLALASSCRSSIAAPPGEGSQAILPADTPLVLRDIVGSWSLELPSVLTLPTSDDRVAYTLDAHWVLDGAFLELTLQNTASPSANRDRMWLGRGEESESLTVQRWVTAGADTVRTVGDGEADDHRIELRYDQSPGSPKVILELDPDAKAGGFAILYGVEDGPPWVVSSALTRRE